jgi:hypothetical protein
MPEHKPFTPANEQADFSSRPIPEHPKNTSKKKALLAAAGLSLALNAEVVDWTANDGEASKEIGNATIETAKTAYRHAKVLPKKVQILAADAWRTGIHAYENMGKIEAYTTPDIVSFAKSGEKFDIPTLGISNLRLGYNTEGKIEIKNSTEVRVDYNAFFFAKEVERGTLAKEAAAAKRSNLEKKMTHWRKQAKKIDRLHLIHEVLQEQGNYDDQEPLLSTVVLSEEEERNHIPQKGNCSARIKYGLTTINALYPDIELKIQNSIEPTTDGINEFHIRLIGRIDKTWYSFESTPAPLQPHQLDGTVLVSPLNYIADSLDIAKDGRKTSETPPPNGPTRGAPGDGFTVLPDGVVPAGSAYGGIPRPPSAPEAFIKQSFEDAQRSAQASAIAEKNYIAEKRQAEKKSEKAKPVEDDTFIRDIQEQTKIMKEKNKAAGIIDDTVDDPEISIHYLPLEERSEKLPDETIVQAKITGRLDYRVFADTSKPIWQQRYDIKQHQIDLSPLAETNLINLSVTGVTVDLAQLNRFENLIVASFDDTRIEHADQLKKAVNLKYFFLDSLHLYSSTDDEFNRAASEHLHWANGQIQRGVTWNEALAEGTALSYQLRDALYEKPLEMVSISNYLPWGNIDSSFLRKARLKFVELPQYFTEDIGVYPLFTDQPLEVVIGVPDNISKEPNVLIQHIYKPSFIGFCYSNDKDEAKKLLTKFMERHPEITQEINGKEPTSTVD